ncbi:5-formyltetrahydrofolate cyclo-ligase [Spiroplasma endosymbiont of Panorpa germanica]|uniref:5-formyltetrahydrofolate cyclo-ligase n=1 Tax=Spiroplasma endosymbiont of Panorpa germanica TaxID=3066314 RepID=UPI0030D37357
MSDKVFLRKKIKNLISLKNDEELEAASKKISSKVIKYITDNGFKHVGIYNSLNDEVSTDFIVDFCFINTINVYMPKIQPNFKLDFFQVFKNEDWYENSDFKIKEPKVKEDNGVDLSAMEIIIVPLVGFDSYKNRLGRGKGYYDRVLAQFPNTHKKIGIGFSFQMEDNVLPIDENDIPLDVIFTEKFTL